MASESDSLAIVYLHYHKKTSYNGNSKEKSHYFAYLGHQNFTFK